MAVGAVTGATVQELAEMQFHYRKTPNFQERGIPFDVAYCQCEIGKQPEDYDGPDRFCRNRASKLTREEWRERYDDPYDPHDERAYCYTCRFHGRTLPNDGSQFGDSRYTAGITHGMRAEDKNLRMDFSDAEQILYDSIVEEWPDIYDWPAESEDPARYLILRKVATNVVRTVRAEDYIDEEGEVHMRSIYDEGVEVGQEPDENPIAGEYRLLVREIVDMLGELGVTPKAQASQSADQKSADALGALGAVAADAITNNDTDYDPSQFDGDGADEDDGGG